MGSNSVVDLIEASSGVHFSGFHMNGLVEKRHSSELEQPTTSATESIHMQPFVIGVAGGAASGKTTVCDMIMQQLHDQRVVLVNQDSFYNNLTKEELARVQDYNFDHPDAFDTEQLLASMDKLRNGQAVDIPKYDLKSYKNNVFPPRRVMISSLLKRHEVSQENIHKAIAGNNAWTTAGESEEEPLIDRKTESIVNGTELSKDDETMANLNIVIATFIAGITFAASVQVPGGYNGEGMANLKDKASFKFFLIYNSMGFGFAAGSLLIHFACEILPGLFRAFGMRFGFTGSAAGFQFVMWFTLCSISCTVVAFMYATNTVLYHNFSKFSFSSLVKSAPTWQLGLPATVANLSFCVPCLYLLFHLGRLYYWLRLKVLYLENGTILGIKVKGTPLLARLRKEKRSEKGHVNMMDFSLWYYIFVIFLVFYFL